MIDVNERVARLKSMLAQTAPSGTIESVIETRAPGDTGMAFEVATAPGAGGAPPAGTDESYAQSGLEKMAQGREDELTPLEINSLEAIVMPENRPVVFVHENGYDPLDGMWTHLNDQDVQSRVTPLLGAIGRIELPHSMRIPYGGTGFLVGENLLMTNRHVARLFTDGVGLGQRLTYHTGDAAIDFHRWEESPQDDRTAYFNVVKVEMIHPFWDMALLRVDGLPSGLSPLTLSVKAPEELVDREIIAVGYPAQDSRSDLRLQDQIFGGKFNVKRLQPGLLRTRARIQSFENVVNAVTHDSSTLGGNSGSAIIDVGTGEVVALHFAGEYLKANYAVPTYELARDGRVVDAGLRFGGSVPATSDWAPAWTRVGATEAAQPAGPEPSPGPSVQSPAASGTAPSVAVTAPSTVTTQNSVTFTVPLTITISIGQATLAGGSGVPGIAPFGDTTVARPAEVEAPRMQVPVILGGLEQRTGYQGGFLNLEDGSTVPLPELTPLGSSAVAKLEDGTSELKYHRFSVVMHRGRRLALFTASNVDWRESQRTINGKKPTRGQLTGLQDGQLEQWVTDWRIPREHQLPDLFFTRDNGAFDKGHIVRRDDVCWGKTFEEIQKGNGDTYHTTNCSPQMAAFNQAARGEDNWGDLETLVQKQTRAEKAIIFAGPVLADDDRWFRGRDEAGSTLVQIPRRFWKIIVVKGADGPEAYGFLLEQDLSAVPLEFAVPANWRQHVARIGDIEGLLNGLARLPWLKNADHVESPEGVEITNQLG